MRIIRRLLLSRVATFFFWMILWLGVRRKSCLSISVACFQVGKQQHHRHHQPYYWMHTKRRLVLAASARLPGKDDYWGLSKMVQKNHRGAPGSSTLGRYHRLHRIVSPIMQGRHFSSSGSSHNNDFPLVDDDDTSKRVVMSDNGDHALDTVPAMLLETLQHEILPKVLTETTSTPRRRVVFLVGVSGGCDSVALLHALEHCRRHQQQQQQQAASGNKNNNTATSDDDGRSFPFTFMQDEDHITVQCHLRVVHFDHQQRTIESDLDRELVEHLCQYYSIPLETYYWNQDHPPDTAKFSQDTARTWRRSRMRQSLADSTTTPKEEEEAIGICLTAHHKDDSDETLILKILRGAHLTKWTGMSVLVPDNFDNRPHDANTESSLAFQHKQQPPSVYWARPLIHLRKAKLVAFLQQHNYTWREDASNQSPKYLRNRVRNELLPLLQDITGCNDNDNSSSSLHRRLDSIQAQSLEIRTDLEERARAYLQKADGDQQRQPGFLLPTTTATTLGVVHKHALYLWITEQTTARQHDSSMFSYEMMQRICAQLEDYPDNRQWRLNLGGGWDILREGERLFMCFGDENPLFVDENSSMKLLEHTVMADEYPQTPSDSYLVVRIPCSIDNAALEEMQFLSSAAASRRWTIAPPWRRKPIRLLDFLRGQKVPLHERRIAPIILLQQQQHNQETRRLVAVYVSTKNQWIVDLEFDTGKGQGGVLCAIRLRC